MQQHLNKKIFVFRKHFIDGHAFECHIKSKPHKRRLNALKTEPYTIEESEVKTLRTLVNFCVTHVKVCNVVIDNGIVCDVVFHNGIVKKRELSNPG